MLVTIGWQHYRIIHPYPENVNFTLETVKKTQSDSSTLYVTLALDGVGCKRHAPTPLLPGKRSGAHCTGGWNGFEKLAPSGFDPRTVQPISNGCTVYAIPAQTIIKETKIFSPAGVRALELQFRSIVNTAPLAYTLKIIFNKIRLFVTNISAILLSVRERSVRPLRCVTDRQQYNTGTQPPQWIPLSEQNSHVLVCQSDTSNFAGGKAHKWSHTPVHSCP